VISSNPYQHNEEETITQLLLKKLQEEMTELQLSDGTAISLYPTLEDNLEFCETDSILLEKIIGSRDSYLSQLVDKLNNSDWVTKGINEYLDNSETCPFCNQSLHIELRNKIKKHIDTTYRDKLSELNLLKTNYNNSVINIKSILKQLKKLEQLSNNKELGPYMLTLEKILEGNINLIEKKINEPSQEIILAKTSNTIDQINGTLSKLNKEVAEFNRKISRKEKTIEDNKTKFWQLLRYQYNDLIINYRKEKTKLDNEINIGNDRIFKIDQVIHVQNTIIRDNLKKTKNIQFAIDSINNTLKSLGMDGFYIQKTKSENDIPLYKIVRDHEPGVSNPNNFKTLSEGEKTLVTFLYFLEKCRGTDNVNSKKRPLLSDRIIVIDDPMSSLSFNYVFDIAVLIKETFLRKEITKYKQVFVLTHHLYFLHELFGNTGPKLPDNFALFRISKHQHTKIKPIQRTEIKNNYECYWQIVKDVAEGKASKIILPNAMRNILEHYFSFIHNLDKLSCIIENLAKGQNELYLKSFYRYIDRSSHSDAINLTDHNDIDINKYLDYFEKIFVDAGFAEHFQIMMYGDASNE